MRADAQESRAAIIAAASEAFREDGANASLESIARRAGVGSATLHRHFEGRLGLLEAVYAAVVDDLAAGAPARRGEKPGPALWRWLDHVVTHCVADAGLNETVVRAFEHAGVSGPSWDGLRSRADELLRAARAARVVDRTTEVDDLLDLVFAIARAAAGDVGRASRLLHLLRVGVERPAPRGLSAGSPATPAPGRR